VETAAASSTAADTVVGPEPEEEFQPEISIEEATGEDDDLEAWAGYAPSVGGSLDDGRAPAPSETPRDPRMGSAEDAATTPGTVSAADGAREASTDPSAFDERPSAEAHLAAESVPTPREAPAEPGSQAPETAGDRGQPEESAAVVSADLLAAEDDAEPLHEPEVLEADVTEAGPERRQGPATPPASPEAGSAASAVPTPLPTPASPAPMPPPPPPTTGPAPSPPATAARIAPPPPPPAPPVTTPRGAVAPPPAPAPARPAASPHPAPSAEEEPTRPKKKRGKAWYEEFFDDAYLRTVRPPRPEQVSRQCDFIEYALQLPKGSTILDVGCGLGLQAIELASRGYLVVGLDLSLPMLARAADEAQDRGVKLNFLHGDMRDMQFDGQFDAVLCLGTTFGYFDDETNKQVLERMRRALKPQGLLLLDSVNRDYVIAGQPNLVWFEGDGCICMEETHFNYITSRLHVKRTVIYDDGRQRDNDYSIRLYALNEIGQLLHHMGFRVAEVSGMEATPGVYFGAHSPRLILLAERRPDAPRLDPPRPEPPRPDAPRPETGKVAAGVPHDGDPPSTA
jgi:SAM-dependent methyltransferase